MMFQKVRQILIITVTVTIVLTLGYTFRTPRGDPSLSSSDKCTNAECKTEHIEPKSNIPVNNEGENLDPREKGPKENDPREQGPEDTAEVEQNGLETWQELRRKFMETPYYFDKFTIIIPTYKRTDNLLRIFKNYCPIKNIIHKIIILWNNVGEDVPEKIKSKATNCSVPVVIKIMERNSLTTRFIPYPEIETAAILSIDDDLMLPKESLTSAFNTWKEYPFLLIGYTERSYEKRNNKYSYKIKSKDDTYSMIMTNVAFIHHFYLDLFTSTIPKKVEDFIIENTNGEDIAMNVLIGKYLTEVGHPQPVGIKMNSKKFDIGNLSKSGYKGLWRRAHHHHQRSQCLNLLAEVYGKLYLEKTNKSV